MIGITKEAQIFQKITCTPHISPGWNIRPRKINVLVLISKKKKNDEGERFPFFFFIFGNWKINVSVLIRKKVEKWQGWEKISYHQKNACVSCVSQEWVFDEERGSFFFYFLVKIRQGSFLFHCLKANLVDRHPIWEEIIQYHSSLRDKICFSGILSLCGLFVIIV